MAEPPPPAPAANPEAKAITPRSTGSAQAGYRAARMARTAGAGLVVGVLTGVGGRADLEPLADVVLDSVEALAGG